MRRPLARLQRQDGRGKGHDLIIMVQPFRSALLRRGQQLARIIGQGTGVKSRHFARALQPPPHARQGLALVLQTVFGCGPPGRQRQFHQIGLEMRGFDSARADVEAIATAWDLLQDLGVQGLVLEVNSLGSAEDRARYRQRKRDRKLDF